MTTSFRAVRTGFLLAALAWPGLAVDNGLLRLVMPDARTVAGISFDQSRHTTFGQYLLARIRVNADDDLHRLIQQTGFDPSADLHEALMASSGPHGRGLLLVRGKFDVAKILAAGKADGSIVSSYRNVPLITARDSRKRDERAGDEPQTIALFDPTLIVAGDPETVRAAIGCRDGGASLDAQMSAMIRELSAHNHAWFVTNNPAQDLAGHVPEPQGNQVAAGDALKGIRILSGGLNFGPNVTLSAQAVMRSGKDAVALADVVRFFTGLVQLNRDKPGAATFAPLLDSMQLTTGANITKVTLTIPEDQVEKFMNAESHHRAPHTHRRHHRKLD